MTMLRTNFWRADLDGRARYGQGTAAATSPGSANRTMRGYFRLTVANAVLPETHCNWQPGISERLRSSERRSHLLLLPPSTPPTSGSRFSILLTLSIADLTYPSSMRALSASISTPRKTALSNDHGEPLPHWCLTSEILTSRSRLSLSRMPGCCADGGWPVARSVEVERCSDSVCTQVVAVYRSL